MFFCKYWEISKKAIFKNICVRLLLKRFQEVIDQDFRSGESLSKIFRLSNITKMPFAFKLEPSLNLIPTLYFGLKFPILIINGYDKKANACSPWTSCSLSSPSRDFASVFWNIEKFGEKNYFTDHQTANTIQGFRDSVPALKIHQRYQDTQKI